jgi:hypothetical protein
MIKGHLFVKIIFACKQQCLHAMRHFDDWPSTVTLFGMISACFLKEPISFDGLIVIGFLNFKI